MKDEQELLENEEFSETNHYVNKQGKFRQSSRSSFQTLLIILIILIFAVSIFYFISRLSTRGNSNLLQLRVTAVEQKLAEIEKQLGELQVKSDRTTLDPTIVQKIDSLSQRIELLEKQKPPLPEVKVKAPITQKPSPLTEKRYHIVQKGETLYKISKKYKISVEEIMKLNKLKENQPLRAGQKLILSSGS